MKTAILLSVATCVLFSPGCTKESSTPSASAAISHSSQVAQHFIGEHFGGGIVFYIDSTAKHGLVAYPEDFEEAGVWSYNNVITGARGTCLGAGIFNTRRIVLVQGTSDTLEDYAALEVAEFTANGYKDWYLPSKDELNELYKQKDVVGGFKPFAYWSSSEVDASTAWFQNFASGIQVKSPKLGGYALRAIRLF